MIGNKDSYDPCEITSLDMQHWVSRAFEGKSDNNNRKDRLHVFTHEATKATTTSNGVLPIMVVRTNLFSNAWVNYIYLHPSQTFSGAATLAQLLFSEIDALVDQNFASNNSKYCIIVTRSNNDTVEEQQAKTQFIEDALKKYDEMTQWNSTAMVLTASDYGSGSIGGEDKEEEETPPPSIKQMKQVCDGDEKLFLKYMENFYRAWGATMSEEMIRFHEETDLSSANVYRVAALGVKNDDKNGEETVIGSGAFIFNPETQSAFFNDIVVVDQCRNQGIGSYLTKHLVRESFKRGALRCTMNATDMGAKIYEKMGFKDTGAITYLYKE